MKDGQAKISYAQITQKKKEEREAKLAAEKAAAAAASTTSTTTSNVTLTSSGSAAAGPELTADSDNTKKFVKEQPAVKLNQFHGRSFFF